MKKFLHFSILALVITIVQPSNGQTLPDGFASVSGKNLETTTGGDGGKVIIAETLATLTGYASSNAPFIIIVKGTIESATWKEINVGSNTTIVGYGTDATLKNLELKMVDKQNIIVRNLTIRDSYVEGDWDGKENDNDGIQADNCHHLWIDHCHFTHLGDGLIDLRKACDFVTVSYTKLSNHNKCFGIGWTEETDFHMTIHHCWIDNTNQRNPSFDMGIGHLYNNYLSNIASYGNLSRGEARIIVQNSSFYKAKDPLSISGNAVLYQVNNQFEACSGNQSGNINTMPFKPSDFYQYTLDPVNQVKDIVTTQAGPQQYIGDLYSSPASTDEWKISNTGNTIRYTFNQRNKVLNLESDYTQNINIRIYSAEGKLMKSIDMNQTSNIQLPLYDLKQGAYILQFVMHNKIETGKIIL